MKTETIYIDFNTLLTLSNAEKIEKYNRSEQKALEKIWSLYNEQKIRLVTKEEDMKMDIVLWLNDKGCCITDMLTPIEAIREFERWGMIDKNTVKTWHRIFYYYDRLELLSHKEHEPSKSLKDFSEALLKDWTEENLNYSVHEINTVKDILRECANIFCEVYPQEKWQDLSSNDYPLNWRVFELAMKRLKIEHKLNDSDTEINKKIFGLLNRFINLSKKSSKISKLSSGHIDFIINTVIEKYFLQKSNDIKHIMNCIYHNIEYLMSTDKKLVEKFRKTRQKYRDEFQLFNITFNILTPSEVKSELNRILSQ